MYVFVVTLHIILCSLLILIILMQPGKGGDVSSAFGGGASSQLFGASGPGNFLTRGTGAIAALFMVTSVSLALYSTDAARHGGQVDDEFEDVLEEGEEGGGFGNTPAEPSAPAEPPAAPEFAPAPETPPAPGTTPAEPAPTPPSP